MCRLLRGVLVELDAVVDEFAREARDVVAEQRFEGGERLRVGDRTRSAAAAPRRSRRPPRCAPRWSPRNDRMRSITERPVSGLVPSASTISGQRSMRSWLFDTMSTRRLCGSDARNAIVSSSACVLRAIASRRAGASRKVCAQYESTAGCVGPESAAPITLSGSRSSESRARSLTVGVGVVDEHEEDRHQLDGRQRQRAAGGEPAHLDRRVAADVALGFGRQRQPDLAFSRSPPAPFSRAPVAQALASGATRPSPLPPSPPRRSCRGAPPALLRNAKSPCGTSPSRR